jgi:hypothetical protein
MTIGGRECGSLGSQGTSGRAEEGAGLGDGRVRRESREGRRADGREADIGTGKCGGDDGIRCRLHGHKHTINGLAVILTTYGGRFIVISVSSEDKGLSERGRLVQELLSAARSRERKERSSVVASGEPAKGLVN